MIGKEYTTTTSKKTVRIKRDQMLVRALREVFSNQASSPSNEVTDANASSKRVTELSDNAPSPAAIKGRNF